MKKFLIILLITLLFLSACTKKSVSDTVLPPKEIATLNTTVIGKFTAIDCGTDLTPNYSAINARQIDSSHIIIWISHYDNSIANMLYLYDLSSNQITNRLSLDNSTVNRVCDDKIIIGNQQEFYTIDFNLQVTSDKTAFPALMFTGMNNYEYPDKWIPYTISEDLQKIVYDNPITGLNYYNLTTNKNHLLFDTKNSPYWYDEYYGDPNLGPECLNFLPGDEEIYFLCTKDYGIWVVNLAGEQIWQTDGGSMSDFWQSVWENQNSANFLCFQENIGYGYGKLYVRQVNLFNKNEKDYKTLPDDLTVSPDLPAPVYNDQYFAYAAIEPNPLPIDDTHYNNPILNENNKRSRIVVTDFATMTPQTVLEFPYSCNINLLAITDDGQVLFSWQEDTDNAQFIVGITDKINLHE